MSADDVAKAFIAHHTQAFAANRAQLQGMYQDQSTMTWEGEKFAGPAAIMGKMAQLPKEGNFVWVDNLR
jgi:hypothetical protein